MAEDQEKGGRKSIHIPWYVSVPGPTEQVLAGVLMTNVFKTAIAMTGYAMVTMFKHLYRNDKIGFQKSQRFRVAAQIMAFAAFAGGMLWEERRKKENTRNAAEAKQAILVQDAPPQTPSNELK